MSKRRQIGDIVVKVRGSSFSGEKCLVIIPDVSENKDYIDYCMSGCEDDACREWPTVWSVNEKLGTQIVDLNGKSTFAAAFYHVSECQMEDENA